MIPKEALEAIISKPGIDPIKVCPECNAAQYPGGGLDHKEDCPARRSERVQMLVNISGLPAAGRTFDTFNNSNGTGAAKVAAKLFCDESSRRHHFITFSSPPGRGKTHLAQAIGFYYIESELKGVRYYQTERMLDQLRACFDRQNDEGGFDRMMNVIMKVPLLILDDLGTETQSNWTKAKVDEIIDERYEHGRLTVFTTNLLPKEMQPRVASRLCEGVVVVLDGQDYRRIKAAR